MTKHGKFEHSDTVTLILLINFAGFPRITLHQRSRIGLTGSRGSDNGGRR